MNSGYVAGVIVICGIVMDIGVNITKFSLVTVTESYMDYIYVNCQVKMYKSS